MGPTWGPPGSCRPQVGPTLAPWTWLSGVILRVVAVWGVPVFMPIMWQWRIWIELVRVISKNERTSYGDRAPSQYKDRLSQVWEFLRDRLIFNMGIPILVRRHLYIETAPRLPKELVQCDENLGLIQYNYAISPLTIVLSPQWRCPTLARWHQYIGSGPWLSQNQGQIATLAAVMQPSIRPWDGRVHHQATIWSDVYPYHWHRWRW